MFFWPASFSCAGCAGAARVHFSMVCAVMNLTVAWNDVDRGRIHLRAGAYRFRGKLYSRSRTLAQTMVVQYLSRDSKEHVELVDLSTFNPLIQTASNWFCLRIRSDTSSRDVVRMLPIIKSCPWGVLISIFECPTSWITPNWLCDTVSWQNPPCLVTISLGRILAGRYSPPRRSDGSVTLDRWDISIPVSRARGENGQKSVKLFLLNNGIAGSKDDYRINSIEIYYQIPATRSGD